MHDLLSSQEDKQKELQDRHRDLMKQNENLLRQMQSMKNNQIHLQRSGMLKDGIHDRNKKFKEQLTSEGPKRGRQAMSQKDHDIQFRKRKNQRDSDDPNDVSGII